ncbi:helix-turn-helix domain-containing protein [Deminuibacter soli]|nr:AraC family transcriptional regulator [Deminuibacter soli]
MDCLLTTQAGERIQLTRDSSFCDAARTPLPGSIACSAEAAFGSIAVQQLQQADYTVWRITINCTRNDTLYYAPATPQLACHIATQGHWQYQAAQQAVHLKQEQYCFCYYPHGPIQLTVKAGCSYSLLCISYSFHYLATNARRMLRVQPALARAQQQQAVQFTAQPAWLTLKACHLLQQLLQQGMQFFRHNNMGVLLTELLAQLNEPAETYTHYTPYELECLYAIKQQMEADLFTHTSISELAHAYHINSNKLKKGFMSLFGTGVFGYLEQVRMQLAATLLVQGEQSLEEIAKAVGYGYESNFIKAFRHYYRQTPNAYRKQHKPAGIVQPLPQQVFSGNI